MLQMCCPIVISKNSTRAAKPVLLNCSIHWATVRVKVLLVHFYIVWFREYSNNVKQIFPPLYIEVPYFTVLINSLFFCVLEIQVAVTCSLADSFKQHVSEEIVGPLSCPGDESPAITVSVYIPNNDQLVCGCEDGKIIVMAALRVARAKLLEDRSQSRGDCCALLPTPCHHLKHSLWQPHDI